MLLVRRKIFPLWMLLSVVVFGLAWPPSLLGQDKGQGGTYAVVVSRPTRKQKDWLQVVECLQRKHRAVLVSYKQSLAETKPMLAKLTPQYVCFVAPPEEITRSFVVQANHLLRGLDADPFWDAQWGIVTGYDAKEALALAAWSKPLKVKRVAAGCGIDLNFAVEGVTYSETRKNEMTVRLPGKPPQVERCPSDTTALLVQELNQHHPDAFFTSGHATNHDWQIGYSYRNGQFRCKDGRLFGIDTHGRVYPIVSPNPKVYSPAGNCLMGLMGEKNTMAVAWLSSHSGGAKQMTGYVVPTWFGALWAVNDYFLKSQGQWSFSQAFHLCQQAIAAELSSEYPEYVNFPALEYDRFSHNFEAFLAFARRKRIPTQRCLGLLWDRDVLVLYGDPAWDARVKPVRSPVWETNVTVTNNKLIFDVRTNEDGKKWKRYPAVIPPRPLPANATVVEGKQWQPVLADNYLALRLTGPFQKGQHFRVVVGW